MSDLKRTESVPTLVESVPSPAPRAQGSVVSGDAYVENRVALMNGKYNGKANGGNFVDLTGTGATVDLPIVHDLGVELATGVFRGQGTTGITNTPIANGTNITFIRGVDDINSFQVVATSDGINIKVVFAANIISQDAPIILDRYYDGTNVFPLSKDHTVVNGLNIIEIASTRIGYKQCYFYAKNSGDDFNIDFTFPSVKEITIPTASYITYLDHATMKHKQISSIGDAGNPENMTEISLVDSIGEDGYADLTHFGDGRVRITNHTLGTNTKRPYLSGKIFDFNINRRYLGEEPYSFNTSKYNQTLKDHLGTHIKITIPL